MITVILSGGPVLWTIAVIGFAATAIFSMIYRPHVPGYDIIQDDIR